MATHSSTLFFKYNNVPFYFLLFLVFILFYIYIYFLLYNIVLVLPYINMNLPRVYTCSNSMGRGAW